MRIFYSDEGPIDTLLQIAGGPVLDGDLVSKSDRSAFAKLGWVAQCQGFNIITPEGRAVIRALKLSRTPTPRQVKNLKAAFHEHRIPWPAKEGV